MDAMFLLGLILFSTILVVGISYTLMLIYRVITLGYAPKDKEFQTTIGFIKQLFRWQVALCWAQLALLWLFLLKYFGLPVSSVWHAILILQFITLPAAFGVVAIFCYGFGLKKL